MSNFPTLRLNFPDGCANEYRLRKNRLEFSKGDGTWRILADQDVHFHWLLHTEVANWLLKQSPGALLNEDKVL